jgi:hypothetical protein
MTRKEGKMQGNRTAEIFQPGGWRIAGFEDLRKNMVFRLRDPDGELVQNDAGRSIFCAISNTYFNKDRVMTIFVRSRMTILAYGEN